MKIVIALVCLVAFAAAVEETGQIDVDLDVAENRHGGGHRGGYGGGYGGGRGGYGGGGGHHGGRYGRSLEEAQPVIVAEFQPEYVDYVSDDLQLAENRYYAGGNGGHGSGGYRGRRSVEDENVAIEDLQAAEHHSGSYNGGHSSGGSSGYGQHSGSYGNRGSSGGSGYGGHGHRGGRSVQEIAAGAIEDLQVAEHHSGSYNRGHSSSGGSGYGNHGSSSGYNSRPSGGHGSHSGHGGRQY